MTVFILSDCNKVDNGPVVSDVRSVHYDVDAAKAAAEAEIGRQLTWEFSPADGWIGMTGSDVVTGDSWFTVAQFEVK